MTRVCPICDRKTDKEKCPHDGYATIDLTRFVDASSSDPNIGRILAQKYRLIAKLGAGGMGSVYKGININLKQDVAVKILRKELADDINAVKRFHREALATSKLKHPNSIRIFDFGQEDDRLLFIVTELLEGKPLSRIIDIEKRTSPARLLKILKQILGSLAEAHGHGVIHRDLKPANIFLLDLVGAHDFVKVLDFGIAKITAGDANQSAITSTGLVIGTPYYMSPEQVNAKEVSNRTDLYALGVIAYECLTGQPPFSGDTALSILMKHKTEPPPEFDPEIAKILPEELHRTIFALLEKEPSGRPSGAEEVLSVLEKIETSKIFSSMKNAEKERISDIDETIIQPQKTIPADNKPGIEKENLETVLGLNENPKKNKFIYFLIPVIAIAAAGFLYFFLRQSPEVALPSQINSIPDAVEDAQVQKISAPSQANIQQEMTGDAAGEKDISSIAAQYIPDIQTDRDQKQIPAVSQKIPKNPSAEKQKKKEKIEKIPQTPDKPQKEKEVDLW
jgi:serine/threonine-protein kinase